MGQYIAQSTKEALPRRGDFEEKFACATRRCIKIHREEADGNRKRNILKSLRNLKEEKRQAQGVVFLRTVFKV